MAMNRSAAAVFVMFLLLTMSMAGLAASPGQNSIQGPSTDILHAKIKEAESDSDLPANEKTQLVELYRRSISNLETHTSNVSAIRKYAASIESATAATDALKKEIARLESAHFKPRPDFDENTSTEQMAQELLKARANLSAVEADTKRLQLELVAQQRRLTDAREELAEANSEQSRESVAEESSLLDPSPAVKKARQWEHQSRILALSSQIKMLDQELLSHNPRVGLLKLQKERREITVDHLKETIGAIEAQLGQRRQADAAQAIALARAAQLKAEGSDPILVSAATENAQISQLLLEYSNAIEKVSADTAGVDKKLKRIEDSFRGVRKKLDVAGMSRALGRILQDQRESLPNRRTIAATLKKKEALISDITLRQLIDEEKLRDLDDIDAYITELLSSDKPPLPGDEVADQALSSEELQRQLKVLLQQRVVLYQETGMLSSTYLQTLSDFEYAQRRLVESVKKYDEFISERLLWVRSAPNPSLESLLSFSGDSRRYFSGSEFRHLGAALLAVNWHLAIVLVVLILVVILMSGRSWLKARLLACNRFLGNPVSDRFSYTLQSLLYTVLLSLPLPLAIGVVGWKLSASPDLTGLPHAVEQALLWLSAHGFMLLLFYQICRPEGLAQRHFGWSTSTTCALRRALMLLLVVFLPLGFFNTLLITIDSSGLEWGIVRLGLIIETLVFAAFFLRILSKKGAVMRSLSSGDKVVLLVRLRWVWLALSVLIPVFLVVLTALGYVFTAGTLLDSFVKSLWVVIVIVLVNQIFVRWLRMTATQLHYQAVQASREKELESKLDANELPPGAQDAYEEPAVDWVLLGRDSLKLVNALTLIVAVIGFFLVWSNILPALAYLDTIQVWNVSRDHGGKAVLDAVTVADIGLTLSLIGVALFLYRNLPSLLELFLLRVMAMSASDRYTAITLTRYLILSVSLFMVAGMLGLKWANFQWLAAALGVGIGFGLQEIVANFISGLIILFERPIRVGDRVTVGEVDGIVTRIRIRATTIQTWARQELLVPNKEFITGTLLNWSLSDQVSRLLIEVGVAYGTDVEEAMAIIARAAEADEKVLDEPAPFVSFEGFGDNTLKLCLRCYLDDMEVRLSTRSRLHTVINKAFNEAGIVIAFPQLDLHIDPDSALNVRLQGQGDGGENSARVNAI